MAAQRLDKIIASTGRWSRREVKDLVRQGRVTVDDVPARSVEEKADPEQAVIAVNGEKLNWRRYTWVMLNKPAGYLSATEDGRGATVLDLLPQDLQRQGLFPVGRLDKDTEGLLLLTNEGGLAHELLSPKKHVDKTYYAKIDGQVTEEHVKQFREGLDIGDEKKTLPAVLTILLFGPVSEIEVTIHEGRFHQIKRMFEAVGCKVTYLKRLSMGSLVLDETLPPEEYRPLTEAELEGLTKQRGTDKNE